MFARHVSMRLKPITVSADFTKLVEAEIIPLMKQQKGFQDELVFIGAGGADVVAISLWDLKENAEAYGRSAYADVEKILAKVVDGTPAVKIYEVVNSTTHKITSRASAA